MGNKQSKQYEQIHLDNTEWEKLEEASYYDRMRNTKTGAEGDYYHLVVPDDQKVDDEIIEYHQRTREHQNLVKVIGVNVEKRGMGFCGSEQFVRVMTQRIPIRLSSVNKLNPRDQLVVLFNALKGFKQIQRRYGAVEVEADQIGINQNGATKVWVSPNYGMNYTSHHIKKFHDENQRRQDRQMTQDIISKVEEASASRLPNEIRQPLLNAGTVSEAMDVVYRFAGSDPALNQNRINISGLYDRGVSHHHNQGQLHHLPPVHNDNQGFHRDHVNSISSHGGATPFGQTQTSHLSSQHQYQQHQHQPQGGSRIHTLSGKPVNYPGPTINVNNTQVRTSDIGQSGYRASQYSPNSGVKFSYN